MEHVCSEWVQRESFAAGSCGLLRNIHRRAEIDTSIYIMNLVSVRSWGT